MRITIDFRQARHQNWIKGEISHLITSALPMPPKRKLLESYNPARARARISPQPRNPLVPADIQRYGMPADYIPLEPPQVRIVLRDHFGFTGNTYQRAYDRLLGAREYLATARPIEVDGEWSSELLELFRAMEGDMWRKNKAAGREDVGDHYRRSAA